MCETFDSVVGSNFTQVELEYLSEVPAFIAASRSLCEIEDLMALCDLGERLLGEKRMREASPTSTATLSFRRAGDRRCFPKKPG